MRRDSPAGLPFAAGNADPVALSHGRGPAAVLVLEPVATRTELGAITSSNTSRWSASDVAAESGPAPRVGRLTVWSPRSALPPARRLHARPPA